MENIKEIGNRIKKLSLSDLSYIIPIIKTRQSFLISELSDNFSVGMKVYFGKNSRYVGIIEKIGKRKATIKMDNGRMASCPYSLIVESNERINNGS